MAKTKIDMTEGVIWKQIFIFSLPLLISNLFQQLYNTVDSIIVGNFVGNSALAAVGSSGSVIQILISFFMGLSVGASVIISQQYGSKNYENVQKAVHTSVALILAAGIFLTIVGVIITPSILKLMGTPNEVMKESVIYLKIYFIGILSLMIYNICSAILRAIGDSKRPLYFLIISSISNIILDIIFVVYLDWGIAGAGWATVVSQIISAVLVVYQLMKTTDCYRLQIKKIKFNIPFLKSIVKIGLPSGLQNTAVSFSNTLVQSSINSFGEIAMAGCSSYQKIEGFGTMPVLSYSMAMTTFVGQNIGAGKIDRVKKGAKVGILMSCITIIIISATMLIFAPQFLKVFNSDDEVVYYGTYMLRTIVPFYIFIAITQAIAGILRGVKKTTIPMIAMMSFWCGVRILWITIGLHIHREIIMVFLGYPVSWFLSMVFLIIYLKKAKWIPESQASELEMENI